MQTIDHKNLADYLFGSTDSKKYLKFKNAFVLGCIAPDYIPFTYMRGCLKLRAFKGHNASSSRKYIESRMKKLAERKVKTSMDFLYFGLMIHYLADSFTFPHNDEFYGTSKEHVKYESELHIKFNEFIKRHKKENNRVKITELFEYIKTQHRNYNLSEQSVLNDCRYISNVCLDVFDSIICREDHQNVLIKKHSIVYEKVII